MKLTYFFDNEHYIITMKGATHNKKQLKIVLKIACKNGQKQRFVIVVFPVVWYQISLKSIKILYYISQNDTIYCCLAHGIKYISQTSGKQNATLVVTSFGSFITELTSPPMQRAALSTLSNFSSLSANFLIVFLSIFVYIQHFKPPFHKKYWIASDAFTACRTVKNRLIFLLLNMPKNGFGHQIF